MAVTYPKGTPPPNDAPPLPLKKQSKRKAKPPKVAKPDTAPLPPGLTWDKIKSIYVFRCLESPPDNPYTLADLSRDCGVSYDMARYMAGEYEWRKEVVFMMEHRQNQAGEVARVFSLINEVDVRNRQAEQARTAAGIAMAYLRSIDPTSLTTKEAVLLLRLGMQEERRALGIAETLPTLDPQHQGEQGGTVEDAIKDADDIKSLGASLMDYARKKLGDEAADVVYTEASNG